MWNRLISTPFLMDVYCLFIVTYLTSSEMNRLSLILGNANLSEESKRTKIAGMVTGIVATQQASQNFEQGMEAESQQQNLQRK